MSSSKLEQSEHKLTDAAISDGNVFNQLIKKEFDNQQLNLKDLTPSNLLKKIIDLYPAAEQKLYINTINVLAMLNSNADNFFRFIYDPEYYPIFPIEGVATISVDQNACTGPIIQFDREFVNEFISDVNMLKFNAASTLHQNKQQCIPTLNSLLARSSLNYLIDGTNMLFGKNKGYPFFIYDGVPNTILGHALDNLALGYRGVDVHAVMPKAIISVWHQNFFTPQRHNALGV